MMQMDCHQRRRFYLETGGDPTPTEFQSRILHDLFDNGMSTAREGGERIKVNYRAYGLACHHLLSKGLVDRRVEASSKAVIWQVSDLGIAELKETT